MIRSSRPGPFHDRHVGPSADDVSAMLDVVGVPDIDVLIERAVPDVIRSRRLPDVAGPLTEHDALAAMRDRADKNLVLRSFIGMGYYGTTMPSVIQRNVLENPGWYTAYTPYQPEIAQGRLEALLNFQTMVADLTGLEIANASLLDEATAAAEAMTMIRRVVKHPANAFFVDEDTHPQTIDVIMTRAAPLGVDVVVGDPGTDLDPSSVFGALLSYPGSSGRIVDISTTIDALHAAGSLAVVATDLLASTLLTPAGELGADVAIGSAQRFGVPMMFGGPHAGFIATRDAYRRSLPGRLVGVSVDGSGRRGLRLALQTREQHIRRDKATSNICTAQVLLAVISGMYAVYHGPEGLTGIAERVHALTNELVGKLRSANLDVRNDSWFDTIVVGVEDAEAVHERAIAAGINLRRMADDAVGVSLDEITTRSDVADIVEILGGDGQGVTQFGLPTHLRRSSAFLEHPTFHRYRSETEMMRYLRRLADKDIALDRSMIPLGSCTMKLNAATEMAPITWPEFSDIHPFAPLEQAEGYLQLIDELESWLASITGYDAVSVQPNSGAQGEFTGLMAIRGFHEANGEGDRDVCLIPESAHGTNPASAVMAGMRVVVVKCDDDGNIDVGDLRERAEEHADALAAIMVTYPSTHGVFEAAIVEICDIVHAHGGQVYLDGANLNAMVGIAEPGSFGSDVSHLNLHKTFAIPHGGGGPGVGPVGVRSHLIPFLPGHHALAEWTGDHRGRAVSAAPWGSAGVLPISWMYIAMLGPLGLRRATEIAVLNANYLAARLGDHYPVLYTGEQGYVAHECILDIRQIEHDTGVTNEDIAKRLIDFGFHAPTMSFPVVGTLMIEPTESESKHELDRFVEAMIAIRAEIDALEDPEDAADSVLRHAPHPAADLLVDEWDRPYTRRQAAYPVASLRDDKYWVPVSRIDNAYGDRHVFCSCPPLDGIT